MSSPPSPTHHTGPVNRRRQSHTSRACNYCRKTRCDGKQPGCSTCDSHGIPCHYSTEKDARKSASKAYVESLKSRISSLEATLEKLGVTSNDDIKAQATAADIDDPHSPTSYTPPEEDSGRNSPGPLMIKESGLQMYGPTSAYSHLPGRPTDARGDGSSAQSEDSAHDSESSRIFDWSCNLPTAIRLSQEQHDLLLNRFFTFYSSWCLRADRYQFTRGMRRALLGPNHSRSVHRSSSRHQGSSRYSPMLHNAILALACTYADNPDLSSQDTRDLFGRTAKSMIDQECLRPTLATVEALALLSSYHASRQEDGLFSLHLGMAVRMGEALGLNVDCSAWVRTGHITQQDMVNRVNVFWSIFIQDKLYALFVGRSASIPMSTVTTPLPRVDPQMDDEPWVSEGKPDTVAPQPSFLSTTFVETCKASLILTRILDVNYSIKSSANHINRNIMVSDIRVQLDAWYDHLPSKLRILPNSPFNAMPHVLMLHVSYWWFSILLHRPFYPHPDAQQLAGKRCDQAADKIVQLFEIWRKLYGLRFTPVTAIQAAFAAGTTYLLGAVHSPPATKRSHEAIKGAKSCIQCLREMGSTYPAALQNAEILQKLLTEWAESSATEPKLKAELLADRRKDRALSSSSPDSHTGKSPSSSPQSSASMPTPTPKHKSATSISSTGTVYSSSPPQPSELTTNHNMGSHTAHHSMSSMTSSSSDRSSWTSGGGGGGSSMHAQPMPMQQWDVSGFQRVLSNMDAAPFSYSTFGIESASNPFPPLPNSYGSHYGEPQSGYGGFMGGGGGGGGDSSSASGGSAGHPHPQHYAHFGMAQQSHHPQTSSPPGSTVRSDSYGYATSPQQQHHSNGGMVDNHHHHGSPTSGNDMGGWHSDPHGQWNHPGHWS